MTDILIRNEGNIVQFIPQNDDAWAFIQENVGYEFWQVFGQTLCVDHLFAEGLVDLLVDYGYEVGEG